MSSQKQLAISDLWGDGESIIELDNTKTKTKKVLEKINNPLDAQIDIKKQLKSKKITKKDKLELIEKEVKRVLGKFEPYTLLISSKEQLRDYIDKCINNNCISIDTETNNSLDPITCKLMGLCLYTPNEKNVYVPVNHRNPDTEERLDWQVTEDDIREELQRTVDNKVFTIMHNGKFDYQVLKCTCNVKTRIDWDTMVACKLINENETSAGLKQQYIDKIDPEQEKYDIEHLFKGVEYADVNPELFALYSATDAYETYKLYEWQKPVMESEDFKRINNLFHNIEMPCVEVVAEMELNGIELDKQYAKRLQDKYHYLEEIIVNKINKELEVLKPQIDSWRLTKEANERTLKKRNIPDIPVAPSELLPLTSYGKSKNEQLEEPINLGSPSQLSILLYDVLKVKVVDTKNPRGTGTDILEKIDLPLCKLLIEYKELEKLLTSFIDALPDRVNPKDGRIHCHFNQFGADTGRFSSSDPNLQQIPSHNKEIRMLFKATDGYTLIGSDYSQQEPRMLSNYSRDENMISAYQQGKDLYATIASGVYHNNYWDNMENYEDGTPNPEGKKRRSSCKSLLLGIMYGRGVASIAEQIKGTKEEAQQIIDNFYKSFPKVKNWMDDTVNTAKKKGYVEDLWGRRRRLPDLLLEEYEVTPINDDKSVTFNPFLYCKNKLNNETQKLIDSYKEKLKNCKSKKDKDSIVEQAKKDGFNVKDNGGFISKAERQCVNARIQGGSATMTKIAMNKLYRDKELNELGFKLLIGVHDELIGECPKENVDKVEKRFTYVMKTAIQDVCDVPFKCDADICEHWYYNDYCNTIREEFEKDCTKNNISGSDLFDDFAEAHCELEKEELRKILFN